MCSQPNTHASPRHKRGPGHRPAQTHLPQVCETCVGTLRQTHRSRKARPTHTSPSGAGTPPCQVTWDTGHHSQPSQRTTPLSHQDAHRSHCQPGEGGKAPPHRLPAGWPPSRVGSWRHLLPAQGAPLSEHPVSPCIPGHPLSIPCHCPLTDSSRVCGAEDKALGCMNGLAVSPLWSGR